MVTTVNLEVRNRRLVVVKRFGGPDPPEAHRAGAARRRELQGGWLARAEGHPVVPVIDDEPGQLTLVTAFSGSATAVSVLRPPASSALLLGAVAAALGDLHRRGLVHGRVSGDHIVVNGSRFRLCSPSGDAIDPAVDVAAFEPLVSQLVSRWERDERFGSRRRASHQARWTELGRSATDGALSAHRLGRRLLDLAER